MAENLHSLTNLCLVGSKTTVAIATQSAEDGDSIVLAVFLSPDGFDIQSRSRFF